MYRAVCLLCAAALLLISPISAVASEGTGNILLLYAPGESGRMMDKIQAVSEILLFMGKDVVMQDAESAKAQSIQGIERIVLLIDEGTTLDAALVSAIKAQDMPVMVIGGGGLEALDIQTIPVSGSVHVSYAFHASDTFDTYKLLDSLRVMARVTERSGGLLDTAQGQYALCATHHNITHFALFDETESALVSALARELMLWMWPYQNQPHAYASYIVLDEVSPVDDPSHLLQVVDMIAEMGVPYAISVVPVYDNGGFPAMKRYCEILRYAQSRGAAIVMRTPYTRRDTLHAAELRERIALGYAAYVQYGVYPLAIQAPKSYLYDPQGLEFLRNFRTVLLYDTDADTAFSPDALSAVFKDGHKLIAPTVSTPRTNAYASAIYLDAGQSIEWLQSQVRALERSYVALGSLFFVSHTAYYGSSVLAYSNEAGVQIDGEAKPLAYEPFEYDANYDFDRGIFKYFTSQIVASSRLLLWFSGIASVIFAICIWAARRAMRKRFLRKTTARKEGISG